MDRRRVVPRVPLRHAPLLLDVDALAVSEDLGALLIAAGIGVMGVVVWALAIYGFIMLVK